ncbi:MAG: S8 family serine peptidase, partial [Chloroflexota bacterium]
MRAQWQRLVLSLIVAVGLLAASGGASVAQSGGRVAPIKLRAGELPAGPGPDRGLAAAPSAGERGYYIVQFRGPVEEAWKAELAGLGAELLDYLPEYAFKVRMTPVQAALVRRSAVVAWVGPFQTAHKIKPGIQRDGVRLYAVRIERGLGADASVGALAKLGVQVWAREGQVLLIAVPGAQIEAIAALPDVAWIQDFQIREKHNEYGAGAIIGAAEANTSGYDGSSQIVAVADTGLGNGTTSGAHPDVPASRIAAIYDWTAANAPNCYNVYGDGPQDVDSGHGTPVALSVLGGGDAAGVAKGSAPAARLVFQAVEDYVDMISTCALSYGDGYYLIGIPADIGQLFQQAYNAGARVHSNSWGSAAAGDYSLDSANVDRFIWQNRDMAITFSAGNAGIDANRDGAIDPDSMGSPATAKNVITVGASENDRANSYPCDRSLSYTNCDAQGGNNSIFTYFAGFGAYFPTNPIKDDLSAGNREQMAAFSSRGPTDDGRIKPDVVAPGTWVLSGYSDLYQQGYDSSANPRNGAWQYDGWGNPYSRYYKYMGGTSMSSPLTAGGAAVVRDYYQKAHVHSASAALVKATLINSADDLLDENNDGANDNDYPIPNIHEGWGRVNLARATVGTAQWVDQTTGLGTGGSASYAFAVSGGAPFKVTLVWSDYPSTEAAAKNLVNDLDLVVTAPDGQTTYSGNVFSGGWSQTGGSADRANNVENVYIQAPAAGTWTVQVSGYNVPYGPQPYALVVDGQVAAVDGPMAAVDGPPSVSIVAPTQDQTVSGTYRVLVAASDDHGVAQVTLSIDSASTYTMSYNGTQYYYDWNT